MTAKSPEYDPANPTRYTNAKIFIINILLYIHYMPVSYRALDTKTSPSGMAHVYAPKSLRFKRSLKILGEIRGDIAAVKSLISIRPAVVKDAVNRVERNSSFCNFVL